MIINKSGIIIRIALDQLRSMGRATQGVRLITLKENDSIASVAQIEREEEVEDETITGEEGATGEDGTGSDPTGEAETGDKPE